MRLNSGRDVRFRIFRGLGGCRQTFGPFRLQVSPRATQDAQHELFAARDLLHRLRPARAPP